MSNLMNPASNIFFFKKYLASLQLNHIYDHINKFLTIFVTLYAWVDYFRDVGKSANPLIIPVIIRDNKKPCQFCDRKTLPVWYRNNIIDNHISSISSPLVIPISLKLISQMHFAHIAVLLRVQIWVLCYF